MDDISLFDYIIRLAGRVGEHLFSSRYRGVDALGCLVLRIDLELRCICARLSGIRCNCVRPGLIVTPQNEARIPDALKDIFLSNILGKRYGNPDDIGHLCVYLASDEAAYMNGQVLTCDGGLNSHTPTVAQFRQMASRTW